jgi:thiol-disulfide isomerase/thioredoxin
LPSLAGATRWLNEEITPDDLRDRPVFVQFWALSCHICKENMPALKNWKVKYGPRGVRFVSVHMPRQQADTDIEAVEAAVREYGMDEPVAIDNDHAIGAEFETTGLWPAYFLFDADGKLRSRAAGAAGLRLMSGALERLIGAADVGHADSAQAK